MKKLNKKSKQINMESISQKEILGTQEADLFLDISVDTLYKLSSSGRLPTYAPTGGKIYFLKSELVEWVISKRRATVKDINKMATKFINF
jgi:excisionase family DNA binding protein